MQFNYGLSLGGISVPTAQALAWVDENSQAWVDETATAWTN